MSVTLQENVHPDSQREVEIMAAESEVYAPDECVTKNANYPDYMEVRQQAQAGMLDFWDDQAKTFIDWFEPYKKVLDDSGAPFFKWFVGGKVNIAYNALDRHVKTWRKNKLALIWQGENGEERLYSYQGLWREVNQFANVLRSMGVKKGEAVRQHFPHWHLYISSQLTDREYVAGSALNQVQDVARPQFDDALHLAVSMRSFRAENLSAFVKAMLNRDERTAQSALETLAGRYPIFVTRELNAAKQWVRSRARGTERYGLLASSKAMRLKPTQLTSESPRTLYIGFSAIRTTSALASISKMSPRSSRFRGWNSTGRSLTGTGICG